jgi:GNAT superfamily N-acetyltransferase
MEIRSIEKLESEAQLRELVREYLNHEISELRAVSGLDLNVDELVANTFDCIDEFLPPNGGLHISIDGGDNLQGCVFLKMIRLDACEIKRLYVKPAARGLGLGESSWRVFCPTRETWARRAFCWIQASMTPPHRDCIAAWASARSNATRKAKATLNCSPICSSCSSIFRLPRWCI